MEFSSWFMVFSISCFLLASGSFSVENFNQAFPIVEPDPGHTKLQLSREGLEAIKRITTPIAAVAVIGPYRSGKSFLLNQLLSLSCSEGFGVGHMRDTKTKGIWVWGTPREMTIDGVKTSVLFLDTEGFESVGKSNVYDDRIFALATVLSSVLIYNLPETIREADISRLSFAVELAEEFYGRVKGQDIAFEPAKLLWLIQRDFLQGKSVHQMVVEALHRVPNSEGDKNIDLVNQIRDSLAIMGDNSTAFSLPQPHLQRTKLCDLNDGELDPSYVKKREQLKDVVGSIIRPKIVRGKPLNGKEFVSFLEQILEALNKGEIPSTGSLVEVFNKGILERCLKLYSDLMAKLHLPLSEESLQNAHQNSREEAMQLFEHQHFGRHHAKKSVKELDEEIEKAYKNVILANENKSSKLCEGLYTTCEDEMDHLQVLRLPTMAKFNAGFLKCNQSFEQECVGPSKASYEHRMMKMLGRSRSLFIKEYNNRLFNWLVTFSLVMVVLGRFIIKFILLEIGAWILFIFLETYTRMFWTAESLYYNPVWHVIVATWETLVYSPVLDLDSNIQQTLCADGFNGNRSSIWAIQGLPVMTLSSFEEILITVSGLATKGCLFLGVLPAQVVETNIGDESSIRERMEKVFLSNGFRVEMIKHEDVARSFGKLVASGNYKTVLFVAEQLRFSDDQMETWRSEFQRLDEEGDEEGFEEL